MQDELTFLVTVFAEPFLLVSSAIVGLAIVLHLFFKFLEVLGYSTRKESFVR
jgi:hypothetical protein